MVLLSLSGCSLLKWGEAKHEDNYRKGVEAFREKNYDDAVTYFRKIPPDAKSYKKSLQLIEKVPLQRGRDALQAKRYGLAVEVLQVIQTTSPHYATAQQLIRQARYQQALMRYQKASEDQKRPQLEELVEVASEIREKQPLLEVAQILNLEIQQESSIKGIAQLLGFLKTVVVALPDADIARAGLKDLFQVFLKFRNDPELRQSLMETIALLKAQL